MNVLSNYSSDVFLYNHMNMTLSADSYYKDESIAKFYRILSGKKYCMYCKELFPNKIHFCDISVYTHVIQPVA